MIERGVVAYLDVLGTKGVPSGPLAVDYARRLSAFHDFAESQVMGAMGLLRSFFAVIAESPSLAEESVDHFSDSLYLWVPIDEGKDFVAVEEIAGVLIRLFHYGLAHKLPIRGGVSIGPFVAGKGIFIGEAVAEAVEWERVAQWSGVLFAPSATSPVIREENNPSMRDHLSDFAWCHVPMKDSPIRSGAELLALAWPNYPPEDLRDRIERLYLAGPLPMEVAAKYINTQGFLDEVRDMVAKGELRPPREADRHIVQAIWDGDTNVTVLPPARPALRPETYVRPPGSADS